MSLPKIGEGFYTPMDAAKILNLTNSKARYWFKNYAREKLGQNSSHKYFFQADDSFAVNFYTLIEMFMFYSLREAGLSAQKIITAHETVSKALDTPYPFARQDLFIGGGELFFKHTEGEIVKADASLQIMINELILPFCKKIKYGDNQIAEKYFPLGISRKVVVDPKRQMGYPTIQGTNIVVDVVANLYSAGESVSTIAEIYGISSNAVQDAVEYYNAA